METILSSIFVLICVFLIIYGLAKNNILLTFVDSETAKIVTRSGSFRKIILNKPGYKISDDGLIVQNGNDPPTLDRIQMRTGIFFLGMIPFYDSIKVFKIDYSEEGDISSADKKLWTKTEPEKTVDNIRIVIPSTVAILGVYTPSGVDVDLCVTVKFQVLNIYLIVEQLKGKFMDLTVAIIKATVESVYSSMGLKDVNQILLIDKTVLGQKIMDYMRQNNNPLHKLGISVLEIYPFKVDPSDLKVKDALSATEIAELNAKAIEVEGRARADAEKLMQEANTADIARLVLLAKQNGLSDEAIAQIIIKVGSLDRLSGNTRPILGIGNFGGSNIGQDGENVRKKKKGRGGN